MAIKTIYICDKCGETRDYSYLSDYELHTDYCTDKLYKADGTKTLELCDKCGAEIKEFFKDKEAE